MARSITITFDAADPVALSAFWATALDYEFQPPPPGFDTWDAFAEANNIPEEKRGDIAAIVDPDELGPRLLFLRVPEGKTAKNRMHLDIHVSDGPGSDPAAAEAAVRARAAELVEAGATAGDYFNEFAAQWIVMTDPEGNEFCVV